MERSIGGRKGKRESLGDVEQEWDGIHVCDDLRGRLIGFFLLSMSEEDGQRRGGRRTGDGDARSRGAGRLQDQMSGSLLVSAERRMQMSV